MEGLGVAASVIALVQLTELTLKLANKHMGLGPSLFDNTEIQSISRALYAFSGMLQTLQTHLRINEEDETRLQTLNHLAGPLDQCREVLKLLSDRLENPTFIGKHIVGEFFDRKLKKALSVIEDARKLIELALLSDQHIIVGAVEKYLRAVAEDVRDVQTTLNENRKRLAEIETTSRKRHQQFQGFKLSHEHDKIIQWLQYTDPYINHNAACEKHEPLTGNWLLQSEDFARWKRELKQFLWLHGIPGCGKTILTSTIVKHIIDICKKDCQCRYIFYYFDFNDSKKQEVTGLLRSVLTQLASRDLTTLKEVEKLYNQNNRGSQQPDKSSLLSTLLSALRGPLRTYFIIDALDECSQREEMLEILSNIYQRCSNEVNILVASRKEHDIKIVLDSFGGCTVGIQQEIVDADIKIHVKRCLVEDVKLKRWPPVVKEEMEDILVRKAHGMFRWVVCQLAVLRNCLKLPKLRQKLKELPETLDETYDRILLSIPEDYHSEVHAVLQWLTHSKRPMSLEEVAEAIAVDRDNQIFDTENRMLDIFSVLNICTSLVTLSEGTIVPKNGRRQPIRELRLAHYSVKEYLVSERIEKGQAKRFAVKENEAHEYMGEACLIYLLSFNKPDSLYGDFWINYPFLHYAAEHWYRHRQAILNVSPKITGLSTALFDVEQGSQFINWLRLHDPESRWQGGDLKKRIGTTSMPLYYASLLGILEAVERLLAAGADVNADVKADAGAADAVWYSNRTALQAASGGGHLEVVKRLLVAGADVNVAAASTSGQTALQAASWGGHLEVVERLLVAGADVNAAAASYSGRTALQAASGGGHLEVVERLLVAGADANAPASNWGWMALQAASGGGHLEVVERLLVAGADVNAAAASYSGQTALQAASRGGHLEVVERLLVAGADANAPASDRGWMALQAASGGGHLEVVKRLLVAGADANAAAASNPGRTALQAASGGGHLEVVEVLLAAGANVNAASNSGQTALQAASKGDHLEVVEKLLAHISAVTAQSSTPIPPTPVTLDPRLHTDSSSPGY